MQGFIITILICYLHIYDAAYVKKIGEEKVELGLGKYIKAFARNTSSSLAIDIYYESKCPDSARFINQQLDKALPLFSDYVNFRLVPFGKANYTQLGNSSLYEFECQHGPQECYGNILHNCIIDFYPKIKDHFPFINCTMSNIRKDIIEIARECLSFSNVSFNQLANDCANQTKGNVLLYKAGYETNNLNPRLNYVPWINMNSDHSNEIQNEAEKDLIKFICTNHKDAAKIEACTNTSNLLKSNLFYALLLSLLMVIF